MSHHLVKCFIDVVKKKLQDPKALRSDEEFFLVLDEVEEQLSRNRVRRVPRMAGEIARDEAIEDPLQKIKINTYFVAFDTTIIQIKDRFNEISNGIFKDFALFSRRRKKEISIDVYTKIC